jgi:hypothetical protein
VRATGGRKHRPRVVACGACGCLSTLGWSGWHAFVVDDPEQLEEPGVVFLCPVCAAREEYSRAS